MNSRVTAGRRPGGAFRPDIEGLRGIAVLLVVLFHCGVPGFRGGYIGVDVFFALSGYLITGLIVAEIEKTAAFSFRNFYARRVRRLLPASGLMVMGVLCAGVILYSPLELARYAIWGTYTSLYFSNFMFARESVNYFAGAVKDNPFLHTWSLAVEEQFYLLWPALIVLVYLSTRSRRRLAVFLLVVATFSMAASIWVTRLRQPWAFFSLPTRAWEFGAGGLVCLLRRSSLSGKVNSLRLLSWAGFVALLLAGHFYHSVQRVFPGWVAVVPVAGTLAILLEGASGAPSILQSMLALPVMQWLGRLSYSWYLWHWPFLIYANACFPGLGWLGKLLVAAGALVTAQTTYWLLENPVRFHPRLIANPAFSLGLALLVPAVGVMSALAAARTASLSLAQGAQQQIKAATVVGVWHDCIVPIRAAGVNECVFGNKDSKTTVVLFGDSHAGQWFPAVNSIAEERHWRLITLLKANCQVAAREVDSHGHASEPTCEAWRRETLERIATLRPLMVVLGESAGAVANPRMSQRPVTPREWEEGLRSTLGQLDASGTKTLVMADIPYSSYDVPVCLSREMARKWRARPCVVAKATGLNQRVRDGEQAAVNSDANARWVDFSDLYCQGSYCQTIIDGFVAYRDDSHISDIFARHLFPQLLHEIDLLTGTTRAILPPPHSVITQTAPQS
jgi:peptidoglycan/LPS O-acetylase OafA/YrhL